MKKNIIVSPSVLSCDFSRMAEEVKRVEDAGAEYLHLDVMDGCFVPNISFGPVVISALRPHTKLIFDTHLMIIEPMRYIDRFIEAGSDIITIHYESCDNCAETLKYIRSKGVRAGIVIKPATPVSVLEPLLGCVDMILIMSVEPGFGGQLFIPGSLNKLHETRSLVEKYSCNIDIEVDGGISPKNITEVIEAGANVIVAGSAVFKADDIRTAIKALRG